MGWGRERRVVKEVGREGIEKEEEVKSSSSVMTFVTISHHLYLTFCLITLQQMALPLRNPILGPTSSSLFEPKCLSFLNTSLKRREPLTLRKWVVQGRTSCYGTYFYLPTYKLQNKKKVFLYSIRNPDQNIRQQLNSKSIIAYIHCKQLYSVYTLFFGQFTQYQHHNTEKR